MIDPDRDALRKALEASNGIQGPTWTLIMDAARRDLARLEREAPKKASLAEIADACEAVGDFRSRQIGQRKLVKEAAAVLRAVEKLNRANEITGTPSRERVEEFLRGLP
jgi:hypothetical protein